MLVGDFAGIGVHAAGCLARFDVAPDHGSHVALVVHESGVEVGCFVGVGGYNVRATSGEGVLQEMEHGEEFALRHEHMVAEEPERT